MSIAAAAQGAGKALEEIIGEQLLRAQMAERERAARAQEALEGQRLNQNQQAMETEGRQRQQQIDRLGAKDRQDNNALGVRRMIGEGITRRVPIADMEGMAFAEGIELPQAAAKKFTPALRVKGAEGGEYKQFEDGQIPEGTQIYEEPKGVGSQAKPKIDIRNVPERGPGGEPGTRVITFNDGGVVSSQWFPGNPTGGERTRIADTESMRTSLDALKGLFKPEYVGPIAGRVGTVGQKIPGVPVDEGQAQFYAATSAVRNAIIKAITGAQMSEPEAKRITSQIPSENDKPEVWNAKYIQSIANVERLDAALSRRQGLGATPSPDMAPMEKPIPDGSGTAISLDGGKTWKRK